MFVAVQIMLVIGGYAGIYVKIADADSRATSLKRYKTIQYSQRRLYDVGCSMYTAGVAGYLQCSLYCMDEPHCLFFTTHVEECIMCLVEGSGITLTSSTYQPTPTSIVYEKDDCDVLCPSPLQFCAISGTRGYVCLCINGNFGTQCDNDMSCVEESYGSQSGGDIFNDQSHVADGPITALHIRIGEFNECFGFTYGSTVSTCHGSSGAGNPAISVEFESNEYIVEVSGRVENIIKQLKIVTNWRTLGPYGESGTPTFTASGARLAYISGNVGRLLDNIRFHFYC